MKYSVYYGDSKCVVYNTDVLYSLNMTSMSNSLDSYIRNMPEPTVSVDDNDFVTMTFEPIPENIASLIIEDDRLRFQVVRHKANSNHTKNLNFPYSFEYDKYEYGGIVNSKYGLSIPNNGVNRLRIVTKPTLSELTSGTIIRDMSDLFQTIELHKCQTYTETQPFVAEFYFGFIYWKSWNDVPDTFKMGYYSRPER